MFAQIRWDERAFLIFQCAKAVAYTGFREQCSLKFYSEMFFEIDYSAFSACPEIIMTLPDRHLSRATIYRWLNKLEVEPGMHHANLGKSECGLKMWMSCLKSWVNTLIAQP